LRRFALSGQVWPLERIPDPVFAQKMVGDGLAIDPGLYYGIFSFAIRRFNLLTPGREVEAETQKVALGPAGDNCALQLVRAFGGPTS